MNPQILEFIDVPQESVTLVIMIPEVFDDVTTILFYHTYINWSCKFTFINVSSSK